MARILRFIIGWVRVFIIIIITAITIEYLLYNYNSIDI